MLPEDYQQYDPVTEADVMAGDYPKLPEKSAMIHLRDPFYPWDMPTLRRNYGEPLQVIITECVFSWKHHTAVHQ